MIKLSLIETTLAEPKNVTTTIMYHTRTTVRTLRHTDARANAYVRVTNK